MSTPHIKANPGDIANVVLMSGDPLRTKWIAETFLHDVKLINDIRGALGFTGLTKNNKRISVMSSGMGQPSMGIYSHELYSQYGVDCIIRTGTCGAYQENINLFDILVVSNAVTDSNWGHQDRLPGIYSMKASSLLVQTAIEVLDEDKKAYHVGNVLCSDVFYDDDPDYWKKWADIGTLGVEMEAYALYCTAAKFDKHALCLVTVTDHFIKTEKRATVQERSCGPTSMIESAIKIVERYAK